MRMKKEHINRLQRMIQRLIKRRNDIRFHVFELNDLTIKKIEILAKELSLLYKRKDLHELMAVCIKECAENGLKANVKRIFFRKIGLNIQNENEYRQGIQKFKENLKPEKIHKFLPEAKNQGYFVHITVNHGPQGITINVANNNVPSSWEQKRILEKFNKALQADTFTQFINKEIDYTEGAGLGLALVITILKKLRQHSGHLCLYHDTNYMHAQIFFPLKKSGIPSDQYFHTLEKHHQIIAHF